MATLADVLTTLTQNVKAAIYPNGTSNPSTAGVDVTVIDGFPIRNRLDQILLAGKALVSVFPTNKSKIVTKFERVFQEIDPGIATLTADVLGVTVTIGGVVSVPQNVVLIVNSAAYSYTVLESDTLDSIALNLSLLIPGATALANVITLDNPYSVTARIVTQGTAAYELSRQERIFSICCWSTSVSVRDNLLNPIDQYLKLNYRLILPDNFYCMVWPMEAAQPFQDNLEKSQMIIGNLEFKVQ